MYTIFFSIIFFWMMLCDCFAAQWKGQASVNFSCSRGNTEKALLTQKLNLERKEKDRTFTLSQEYRFCEVRKKTNLNRMTIEAKYDRDIGKVEAFAFLRGDSDRMKDAERGQLGAGIEYTYLNLPRLKESISGAVILEQHNADGLVRLSVRKKTWWKLTDTTTMTLAVWCQPSISDMDDILMKGELIFSAKITEKVQMNISAVNEYDSQSVKKKHDFSLTSGITWKF